jgi:CRP-like cAMP-binding protein
MYEALIKNLTRFISLSEEEAQAACALFSYRKFRKHQFILQEGDVAYHETFILKGLTRTYEIDAKGGEHIVQFGIEDWWVGDLYSFLSGQPTKYNIDCIEDTEVLQITREQQEILFQKVPKLERHFRIMIQNAYVASVTRIAGTLAKSAMERYRDFIEAYPHIEQRVPNHQIASYLGITPQSLSRIRAQSVAAR